MTFSGIICRGMELTALVRYASLGCRFYTELSVTLSKTSDYCRSAFSAEALEKGKQTRGILEESHSMSIQQAYVRYICPPTANCNILTFLWCALPHLHRSRFLYDSDNSSLTGDLFLFFFFLDLNAANCKPLNPQQDYSCFFPY